MRKRMVIWVLAVGLLLVNCSRPWQEGLPPSTPPGPRQGVATEAAAPVTVVVLPGSTDFTTPTAASTPISSGVTPEVKPSPTKTATITLQPRLKIWVDPVLPQNERDRFQALGINVATAAEADLRVWVGQGGLNLGQWVLALVAPFPTLTDGVTLADLKAAWQGSHSTVLTGHALLCAPVVLQALERFWGPPTCPGRWCQGATTVVRAVSAEQLLDTAWKEKTSWAIVPFETLQPRWKVLKLDGRSPLDKVFDPAAYGLTLPVAVEGDERALVQYRQWAAGSPAAPLTNRDPKRLTVVLLTGTSGLTRGTAWFMEQKGLLFPGRDVRAWMREPDITHVSHEVSFNPKCPPPNPSDPNLRFCSAPKNIQLFEDMGVKVVEMTGNHLNDFGSEWVNYSIDLYRQHGWLTYGAGANQQEARKPIRMEHNGNKLAFLGCNPAGPWPDWATKDQAGTADCDYPDMTYFIADIRQMVKEGYLPIVTVQFYESLDPRPLPIHYQAFQRLSDAGAVIVSGSQAHLPQAMELRNSGFIHYGLGNLFFDQMDTPWPQTKDEFLDRHVFYDGRYLGVELLTAQLEEWVKPRPMTAGERDTLLKRIFEVSGWAQTGSNAWR